MPLEYALQFRGKYPDPGPWKETPSIGLKEVALGIGELPQQKARRSKNRRYGFNIMVCGESGLGKTTFLNTLFNAPLTETRVGRNLYDTKTTEIVPKYYELMEEGVKLNVTVVDTPGFGDQLNRAQEYCFVTSFQPIIKYIEQQYEKFFAKETSTDVRRSIIDSRIHALLYFLPPTGKSGINNLDLEFMQKLSSKVNVIPVIAKADALTREELDVLKKGVLADLARHDIHIYPIFNADDRENISEIEKHVPFAVIGSNEFVTVNGKSVRGRTYKWGYNMQDLLDTTHSLHYAVYRANKLRTTGRPESFLACDDLYESRVETAKSSLEQEMQRREDEMRQRFVAKVREKEQELREREESLNKTRQKMMEELEALRKAVEQDEAQIGEIGGGGSKYFGR